MDGQLIVAVEIDLTNILMTTQDQLSIVEVYILTLGCAAAGDGAAQQLNHIVGSDVTAQVGGFTTLDDTTVHIKCTLVMP